MKNPLYKSHNKNNKYFAKKSVCSVSLSRSYTKYTEDRSAVPMLSHFHLLDQTTDSRYSRCRFNSGFSTLKFCQQKRYKFGKIVLDSSDTGYTPEHSSCNSSGRFYKLQTEGQSLRTRADYFCHLPTASIYLIAI